jgi:citrate synthase
MEYYDLLAKAATGNNFIPPEAYGKYNVKRGLRNEDGTGVLAGITTISSVYGRRKEEGIVYPVEGRLFYRGLDIGDMVRDFAGDHRFAYEKAAYLLLFGDLPEGSQLKEFSLRLGEMRRFPDNFVRDVLQTFRTGNIMNALGRSVLTLYSIDNRADDLDPANQVRQAMEFIAKIGSLVPYAYHVIQHHFHDKSLFIHKPDPMLSAAENFLRLLRPSAEYTAVEARTLDLALFLHADHGGGNNSTFVTRAVSSTMTDFYSSIGAAIGSLKGPLHGGANAKVVAMMDDLIANVDNPHSRDDVRDYLFRTLDGKAFDRSGKIYGVGHAVYTRSDPRTGILKENARDLARETGREDILEVFELVEEEAPKVFAEHKNQPDLVISANVDFYSGFVYDCLRIPREVFTPIFAIGRMAGWCAHRLEVMTNPVKIMRPGYKTLCKYCRSAGELCQEKREECKRKGKMEFRDSLTGALGRPADLPAKD